jgi:hypothetical protein
MQVSVPDDRGPVSAPSLLQACAIEPGKQMRHTLSLQWQEHLAALQLPSWAPLPMVGGKTSVEGSFSLATNILSQPATPQKFRLVLHQPVITVNQNSLVFKLGPMQLQQGQPTAGEQRPGLSRTVPRQAQQTHLPQKQLIMRNEGDRTATVDVQYGEDDSPCSICVRNHGTPLKPGRKETFTVYPGCSRTLQVEAARVGAREGWCMYENIIISCDDQIGPNTASVDVLLDYRCSAPARKGGGKAPSAPELEMMGGVNLDLVKQLLLNCSGHLSCLLICHTCRILASVARGLEVSYPCTRELRVFQLSVVLVYISLVCPRCSIETH